MIMRVLVSVVCLVSVVSLADAQSVTVSFTSGTQMVFNQNTAASIPLTGGTTNDGDGTVLQLGYYTGATNNSSNFTGTWTPLSGQGSFNTAPVPDSSPTIGYNQTSIGDRNSEFAGDGTFALQLTFTVGDAMSGMNLPSDPNTILSIRFFNGTTLANSTVYNTVSNDNWKWGTPSDPPNTVLISLSATALEWESIFLGQAANTAFHTTIPIPEPSTYALLGLGACGMLALRRRLKG